MEETGQIELTKENLSKENYGRFILKGSLAIECLEDLKGIDDAEKEKAVDNVDEKISHLYDLKGKLIVKRDEIVKEIIDIIYMLGIENFTFYNDGYIEYNGYLKKDNIIISETRKQVKLNLRKLEKSYYDGFALNGPNAIKHFIDTVGITDDKKKLIDDLNEKLKSFYELKKEISIEKEKIVDELIDVIYLLGIENFAFYDDGYIEYIY